MMSKADTRDGRLSLTKVQSVDQRMRLECGVGFPADVPSHTSRAAMRQRTNPLAREGAGFEVGAYAAASIECVNDQG